MLLSSPNQIGSLASAALCLLPLKIQPLTQDPARSKSSINFASDGGDREEDDKDEGRHEVMRCDVNLSLLQPSDFPRYK